MIRGTKLTNLKLVSLEFLLEFLLELEIVMQLWTDVTDQLQQSDDDLFLVGVDGLFHSVQSGFSLTMDTGFDVFLGAQILLFVLFELTFAFL